MPKLEQDIDPKVFAAFRRRLQAWIDEEHDGNQSAAARSVDMTPGSISGMLSGRRDPGLETLLKLREPWGVSLDDMLGLPPPRKKVVATPAPAPIVDVDKLSRAIVRVAVPMLREEISSASRETRRASAPHPSRRRKET